MSDTPEGASAAQKLRLLWLAFAMELYSALGALVAMLTSNSITFVANMLIAISGVLATGLSLHTVRKMAAGKDDRYSYGFGKLESISSIVVAVAMSLSALVVAYTIVVRLRHP